MKGKLTFSAAIAVVGVLVMVVALFLPYASAVPEFKEALELLPADEVLEGSDIPARSAIRVSVVEFVSMYLSLSRSGAVNSGFGTYYLVLAVAMGVFALMAGVFAVLRKPALVILSDLLAFVVFVIHNTDYANRGVVPGLGYRYGIGYYLFYIASVVVIAGGIWLLKEKKREPPKPQSQETDTDTQEQ